MAVLDFFVTGQGVLTLGILAAMIVLLWDWRVALGALVLIQIGVAALLTQIEGASGQIMFVQSLIIALSATMVAIAAVQVHLRRSGRQSGGWLFRLLVLALLGIALYTLDLTVVLPEIAPAITRIFGWIALIALIMLSLGDNPVFTITALLIWCVLGQALAAHYAPAPEVMIAIGLMELVLGLTASYLLLAEQLPRRQMAEANANAARAAARPAAPAASAIPARPGEAGSNALLRRGTSGTQTNLPAVPPAVPPTVPAGAAQGATPSRMQQGVPTYNPVPGLPRGGEKMGNERKNPGETSGT